MNQTSPSQKVVNDLFRIAELLRYTEQITPYGYAWLMEFCANVEAKEDEQQFGAPIPSIRPLTGNAPEPSATALLSRRNG
ncbi:hypothetical protein O5O45_16105 [Hahella aquimaris]|uniref:hypothetical protein n=1 Tax=Hahella sp. HNIBRBA332 TaxID=3015983 RepID=UPI00273B88A9|nr:hypothetical protein [Hahella sp. HNIBRBA332]WLQ11269.1 hypothetical protein O5O45_16105 [Hahella sp. HNIBRBA332]